MVDSNATATRQAVPDPDPEADRSYYTPVVEHSNGARAAGHALTLQQTIDCAKSLIDRLRDDPTLRARYYNLSHTWHANRKSGMHGADLEFGEQLCDMIETSGIPLPALPLQLGDFDYMHTYVFFSLRRSVLALTGHDIDPDAWPSLLESYHWTPNGPARPPNLNILTQMGFSETEP